MKIIGELIERNERYYPEVDAYVMDGRRLNYRQYAERVRRLGSALYRLGLRRQDRAAIFSTNNIEYFELYGACEWTGYILALYNFRLAAPEVAWLLQDAAPGWCSSRRSLRRCSRGCAHSIRKSSATSASAARRRPGRSPTKTC